MRHPRVVIHTGVFFKIYSPDASARWKNSGETLTRLVVGAGLQGHGVRGHGVGHGVGGRGGLEGNVTGGVLVGGGGGHHRHAVGGHAGGGIAVGGHVVTGSERHFLQDKLSGLALFFPLPHSLLMPRHSRRWGF